MKEARIPYLVKFSESTSQWIDGNKKWIQLYPYDSWDHPLYGTTTVDRAKAEVMVKNFNDGIRGQEILGDYEHGVDPAKGRKASSKFVKVEARDDGLWGLLQFTDEAKKEIDAGEWNYWSTSHYETWTHPQQKTTYKYVLDGGGLTNRPWVKGMVPLNFSELFDDLLEFADPNKPYGNVTYADPGYQSDKKKRYPLDTEKHVRAAWSYINQKDNAAKYTPDQLRAIKFKIVAAMRKIGARLRNHAEALELAADITGEHSDFETMEPGTNAPDPETNRDDSADEHWRLETPPAGEDGSVPDRSKTVENKGGDMENELEKQLREALNLDENADIIKSVTEMRTEIEPLREAARQHSERKQFSELFPHEHARMQQLEKDNRENFAKQFSESLVDRRVKEKDGDNEKDTTVGLSGLAIEKARECALKFSEGTITFDDFRAFTDAIYSNGLVDYGTKGSSNTDGGSVELPEDDPRRFSEVPADKTKARKLFAEAVVHYQHEFIENDKMEAKAAYSAGIEKAAKEHPELYDAYMNPLVAS